MAATTATTAAADLEAELSKELTSAQQLQDELPIQELKATTLLRQGFWQWTIDDEVEKIVEHHTAAQNFLREILQHELDRWCKQCSTEGKPCPYMTARRLCRVLRP